MTDLFYLHGESCFCFQIGTVLPLALTRELPVIVESINAYHENLQLFAYWSFHESETILGWERLQKKQGACRSAHNAAGRTVSGKRARYSMTKRVLMLYYIASQNHVITTME
jgi:hypothetical protein